MRDLFYQVYELFQRKRFILYSFLFFLVAFIGIFGSKITLQEDISALIPDDNRINQINYVLEKSSMADKIVFNIQFKDSTIKDDIQLIKVANILENHFQNHNLVSNVSFKVDETTYNNTYDFFYNNIPFFLDEEDYSIIEEKITKENIEKTLKKNFQSIATPAGLATGKYILSDPLHIIPLGISKLEKFKIDDSFQIRNGYIFTSNGNNILGFIEPRYSSKNTSINKNLIQDIDSTLASITDQTESIYISYYGGTAVAVANADRIKKDIVLTLSIALILIVIFSYIVFRKFKVFILLFLPVVLGAGTSMAILYLIEGRISAISLGVGAMLLGISIDYSLHFFSHLKEKGSIKLKLRVLTEPIIMSSITTASAFLCLLIVKSDALNQLGIFAAFSIILTAFLVLLILPSLLKNKEYSTKKHKHSFIDKVAKIPYEKNKFGFLLIIILTIIFYFTSSSIRFNTDISNLNYQTKTLEKAQDELNKIGSEAHSSVFLVSKESTLNQALIQLEKQKFKLDSLSNEGVFNTSSSATDLLLSYEMQQIKIKRWNEFWEKHSDEEVFSLVNSEGIKNHFNNNAFRKFQNLLTKKYDIIAHKEFEKIGNNILDNYITHKDSTYILSTILKVSTENKPRFFQAFKDEQDIIIFDQQYFTKSFVEIIKEDFNKLVTLSLIIVFIVLLIFFGRIELTLVAYIPILMSWLWTLGLMGLFNLEFNIFNVIISTFVFGLGIDYCIFMTRGLINQHKYGKSSLSPFRLSIIFSTITTLAGIGVLGLAQHPALKSIALVSIFGIISSMIMSFFVVPVLFSRLVRSKYEGIRPPLTILDIFTSVLALIIFLTGSGLLSGIVPLFMILPFRMKKKKYLFHVLVKSFLSFVVNAIFTIPVKIIDKHKLDFSKPSIIISNHQSHLDLALLLMLNPKILVLTNKWVWNNPIYGLIVRFADYFPTYKGIEYKIEDMKKKVAQGYSILVFPEGTRSVNGTINRFHQGAFLIADKLDIDLQPILLHGPDYCLNKKEFFLRRGKISLKILDRIPRPSVKEGETYRLQAKATNHLFRKEFSKLRKKIETPDYYKDQLIRNYLYKGPILEWYLRVKINLEKNYTFFDERIPRNAIITDLGCGYGFLCQMLMMTCSDRRVHGIDYDNEKIRIASKASSHIDGLSFESNNIVTAKIPNSDVFIINDVLHYLTNEDQETIITKCMSKLNDNGIIFIRDADSELIKRTNVTKLTEFFSIKLLAFNKSLNEELCYTSSNEIKKLAQKKGFRFTKIDNAKHTSNIIFMLTKTDNE